jgi:hypothetical protein
VCSTLDIKDQSACPKTEAISGRYVVGPGFEPGWQGRMRPRWLHHIRPTAREAYPGALPRSTPPRTRTSMHPGTLGFSVEPCYTSAIADPHPQQALETATTASQGSTLGIHPFPHRARDKLQSGWEDSNLRLPLSERGTLTY